jgi:prepilin-type N-terminal cleavage/methylation domain-containing protein
MVLKHYGNKKVKHRGFTLIEILLVVGLIALSGMSIYLLYDKVRAANAANEELKNMKVLVAEARSISNGYGLGNLNMAGLVNLGVFPKHLVDTSTTPATVKSSLGGNIVGAAYAPSGASPYLLLNITNIPRQSCLPVVVGLAPHAGRMSVGLGGPPVINVYSRGGQSVNNEVEIPVLDVSYAASRCGVSPSTTIILYYKM